MSRSTGGTERDQPGVRRVVFGLVVVAGALVVRVLIGRGEATTPAVPGDD